MPDHRSARPYFQSLPAHDREELLNVPQWRWIASSGFRLARPIHLPAHQRWIDKPGHLHTPAHREIQLVLSGSGPFSLNHQIYRRAPGTLFLFNHYEARDWVSNPDCKESATALWLHLPGARRNTLTYNTVTRDTAGRQIREIAHRIYSGESVAALTAAWDEHLAAPTDRLLWELLKSRVTTLLLHLLQITTTSAAPPTEAAQARIIELACHYISDHLSSNLTLHTLSRITGYSPFFLHRLFHQHTGQTPKDYINSLRLQRTRELLTSGYTLSAIAQEIGFSTPYALSRFFKERTGLSPQQWRLRNGE